MLRLLLFALLITFAAPQLSAQTAEEIENSSVLVETLFQRADKSTSIKEKTDLNNQALSIARSLRFDGAILRACMNLGDLALKQGKTEEALQHYLEAESKAQSSKNTAEHARAYRALGDLFQTEKLYETARRYYRQALVLEPSDWATMEKAADVSLLDMRFDSAEYYYKELISKYKKEGNNPRLVQIYQKLANAYNEYGDPGKGLFYYLNIESIIERFGSPAERALLYNNMGKQYASLFDYKKALEYFRKAELQCNYIPCEAPEVLYANLGVALHNTGNDDEAILYLQRSRDILANQQEKGSQARVEHLIASVYLNKNDYYNAINHNEQAINLAGQAKDRDILATSYRTAAELQHQLYDFEKAFDYYQKYLVLLDSIRFDEQTRQQRLNQQRAMLSSAEGQIRYLLTRQNIKDLELQNSQYEQEQLKLANKNLALETERSQNELQLLQKQKEIDQARQRELMLQNLRASQDLRLAAQQLSVEKRDRLISDLRQQETIDRAHRLADSTSRAQEIQILQRDKALTQLQLQQQASFRKFAYGLGALGLVILGLLGAGWWIARRTGRRLAQQNRKIEAQKELIEIERHKSDQLLLNILPEEIAQELRTSGHADPQQYQSATVLFTDFVNFTQSSAQLSPEALIGELDECFLAFDEICDKHQLEKIKTIGDSYMCVGGVPVANDTHPTDAVAAAIDMMRWLHQRNHNNPNALFRQMRIGIHTGPVIAGVIGKNKFAYDIWGDAVNLAARLEELSEPDRINISTATKNAIGNRFPTIFRGQKEVHNKGLVEMYFVET